MSARMQPDICPDCGQPFDLPYKERKKARLTLTARLILTTGPLVSAALIPILFVVTAGLVGDLTEGRPRRERGMVFFLAHLLSIGLALLPAWLSWRYAFRRPRNLDVQCPHCPWRGTCRVRQEALAPATLSQHVEAETYEDVKVEFEGIPLGDDPIAKKRERLEALKRKRIRQARRALGDPDPNPDFDFDK
jgi:hypothetical protein